MFLCWNVSVLCMTTKALDDLYWFGKVWFEYETMGFHSNRFFYGETSPCWSWQPEPRKIGTDLKRSASNPKPTVFLQQLFPDCETSQCCPWLPDPGIIGTDLKRSASNLTSKVSETSISILWNVSMFSMTAKPRNIGTDLKRSASNLKATISTATVFLWWSVSMLFMTTKTYDNLHWFEEVCFESETDGFCSNLFLVVIHLNVVHESQHLGSSVRIRRDLSRNRNLRFLQQLYSYGETSQCCPWQPTPWMICNDLKRSASNLKPTVSATTIFWFWNVSMLSMSAKAYDHRYWFERSASNLKPTVSAATIFSLWKVSMLCMTTTAYDNRYWFEEVCFEPEANGFWSSNSLMVRRLDVVHDGQHLKSSVMIWRGLLRIGNLRFLEQPFYVFEASHCCPIHQKPMMIGTELKRSASNLKPEVSATTVFLLWNVPMLSMTTKA